MKRLIEAMQAAMESGEESMPAMNTKGRSSRAAVEKMISAMLAAPQVRNRAAVVVGRDGDIDGVLDEIEIAIFPAIVMALSKMGIKVSGESEAAIKQSIRAGL